MSKARRKERRPYRTDDLPPCNECGLCCVTDMLFGRGGFVMLSDADYDRLPQKYRLKVVTESELNTDRLGVRGTPTVGYRCVALRGTPNVKTSCDIYDNRPDLCRDFERGSKDCRKERARWLWAHKYNQEGVA